MKLKTLYDHQEDEFGMRELQEVLEHHVEKDARPKILDTNNYDWFQPD